MKHTITVLCLLALTSACSREQPNRARRPLTPAEQARRTAPAPVAPAPQPPAATAGSVPEVSEDGGAAVPTPADPAASGDGGATAVQAAATDDAGAAPAAGDTAAQAGGDSAPTPTSTDEAGIRVDVNADNTVHIVTTDRWENPFDQTFESCEYVRRAVSILNNQLSEERVAILIRTCGTALPPVPSRRGGARPAARPAPRPAAARPAAR